MNTKENASQKGKKVNRCDADVLIFVEQNSRFLYSKKPVMSCQSYNLH